MSNETLVNKGDRDSSDTVKFKRRRATNPTGRQEHATDASRSKIIDSSAADATPVNHDGATFAPKSYRSEHPVDDERKARILSFAEKKVTCEQKALKIVERLLDGKVEEDYLGDAVKFLDQSHYDDVTVERAISYICGYPLCNNPLEKVLHKKYHISTKLNRVYNISERKNFCSNFCYKASKDLKDQILSSPIWAREDGATPPVKFLQRDDHSGKSGEEVVMNPTIRLKKELELLDMADKAGVVLEVPDTVTPGDDTRSESSDGDEDSGQADDKVTPAVAAIASPIGQETPEDKLKRLMALIDQRDAMIAKLEKGEINATSIDGLDEPPATKHKPKVKTHEKVVEKNIEKITETLKDVKIVRDKRTDFMENIRKATEQQKNLAEVLPHETVMKILRSWKTDETVVFLKYKDSDGKMAKEQPQTEFDKMVENTEQMSISARKFLSGDTNLDSDDDEGDTESTPREPVMPFVDSHSEAQVAIRRRIVLDAISKVLSRILPSLGLLVSDISASLKEIVNSFRLTKDNVTLKPLQWNMTVLVILKLLSGHEEKLAEVLNEKRDVFEDILKKYSLSSAEIDDIITDMKTYSS